MVDKRQHPRVSYNCLVTLEHPEVGDHVGHSIDISDSGLFVTVPSELELPLGSELSVQVVTGLPKPRRVRTQIVRRDKNGLGLRFLNS